MAGFLVTINGDRLASVPNDGLNILTVQVHGDVIGKELATIEIFGGNYGQGKADKHLIWISDYEISTDDDVDVCFLEDVATSHPGKTIEELYPEAEKQVDPWQQSEEAFQELAAQPKTRGGFSFHLIPSVGKAIQAHTHENDFSFHFSAMWRWVKPREASVWLTSNSLERVEKRQEGSRHVRLTLQMGQSIKLCIGSQ